MSTTVHVYPPGRECPTDDQMGELFAHLFAIYDKANEVLTAGTCECKGELHEQALTWATEYRTKIQLIYDEHSILGKTNRETLGKISRYINPGAK